MGKKKVAVSDGHEMTTSGKRTPPIPELNNRVIHENEFNKSVALLLEEELKRCGFDVINVSSTDNDSLSDRVIRANNAKADIFVAIHYNAFDGKFDAYDPEGLSVHIYPGSIEGRKLGESVLKYLKGGTPQKNRGIKEDNFYVLRKTFMPAILTENGFMDNKREAMLMLDPEFQKEVAIEHSKGICDYFGMPYISEVSGTPIMGNAEVSAEQLCKYLLSINPNPKIKMDPLEWCKLWISEAAVEGVNAGPAFCQMCHETGYLKYGGQVLPEQNNYGGIGATNNSPVGKGAWFDTEQIGVRASIQHLKAYGSKEPLKQKCVDPRFSLVTRGSAPNFEDLGGKWAWPGYNKSKYTSLEAAKAAKDTYGHFIIKKYEDLKKVKVDVVYQEKESNDTIEKVESLLNEAINILLDMRKI